MMLSIRTRKHDIHLRLNDQEYAALMKNAAKCNMPQQTFLRHMCLRTQPKEAPSADFAEFIGEIRKIGTNINQIARVANSKGDIDRSAYSENYMHLLDEINRLRMTFYFPEWITEEYRKEEQNTKR